MPAVQTSPWRAGQWGVDISAACRALARSTACLPAALGLRCLQDGRSSAAHSWVSVDPRPLAPGPRSGGATALPPPSASERWSCTGSFCNPGPQVPRWARAASPSRPPAREGPPHLASSGPTQRKGPRCHLGHGCGPRPCLPESGQAGAAARVPGHILGGPVSPPLHSGQPWPCGTGRVRWGDGMMGPASGRGGRGVSLTRVPRAGPRAQTQVGGGCLSPASPTGCPAREANARCLLLSRARVSFLTDRLAGTETC